MSDTAFNGGTFVGRVWRPDLGGPSLVTIRDGALIDITSKETPTMRDLFELPDPVAHLRSVSGERLAPLDACLAQRADASILHLIAPCDLQAVKACGVTFARSMIERVIEERAAGDASRAEAIRSRVTAVIGDSLRNLKPGSQEAARVKAALQEEGVWSQYLEVGIGPDAEVFTKAQVLSAVGPGADVGLHPASRWNNPEPEIVLAVSSSGQVKGATLGNDVNLRDIEGRSALLLGKAKDNNASCAIGPFIRFFDETYTIDDVRKAELTLVVEGEDGYRLTGRSSMAEISRDPLDLVAQTIGPHHQYPDGVMLFMGTLFAPVEDRDEPGQGFTHKLGDVVTIANAELGRLTNTVTLSTECTPWSFGAASLMRNLARRGLL
ncbi:fumarylacetoacetate hydrolase family protein [Ensifer adhaerens]|uniref:fumarylacetoacetate hydrolase family protein n=1 Tax=Ensifer adhaerens TaxID=106592 RepID=UPI001CBA909A|nr:fumarylacetoacetate hydrolase family protein [Ensifer adhaerens]MBZ7920530.1 fumarylacetoacetate hydrolase family protein [Ensifer adhaerens]UAX93009.1 fumarylacetoacetate hydrolase family protein [Ensifer adhaerens]UAY00644.1 fumarylacetoacetate hydrolase family protein [Ensifer adhaerens]UAY08025.1 fumarylacetoacetate hydrolase family protein [Ensifer adhaerens]